MKIRVILMMVLTIPVMLGMLEGRCPKCGTRRIGWALLNPRHQTCPKCGAGLEIRNGGRVISKGYSPFTADKYLLKPPNSVTATDYKITREQSDRGND